MDIITECSFVDWNHLLDGEQLSDKYLLDSEQLNDKWRETITSVMKNTALP